MAIVPNSLALSAVPEQSPHDDWDVMEIAGEAIDFLIQEGFITAKDQLLSGEYGRVRLTMKGLAVLGSIPVSLSTGEPKEPIIKKIGRVLGAGGEKLASETTQAIVSEVFKYALSSSAVIAAGVVSV